MKAIRPQSFRTNNRTRRKPAAITSPFSSRSRAPEDLRILGRVALHICNAPNNEEEPSSTFSAFFLDVPLRQHRCGNAASRRATAAVALRCVASSERTPIVSRISVVVSACVRSSDAARM
ncbi:hypothetical protein MTO96_020760 [Rhipicephalus appendiculatus]